MSINLDNLTQEEQAILASLLEKSRSIKGANAKVEPQKNATPVKKRGRPKKSPVLKQESPIVEKPNDNISPTSKQIKKKGKASIKKKKRSEDVVKEKEKGDGIPCRIERLDLSGNRPNKFLDMVILDGKSEDAKIDKKIKRTVSTRNRKPSLLNDVECSKCEYLFDNVPAVLCGQEDNKYTFVCSECAENLR